MDIEFHKVTLVSASSSRRTLTVQLRGAGSEGDDTAAEGFDAAEAVQPAGLVASPTLTATTEAVVAFRGDEAVALFLIDKGAAAQSVESGETRLHGVGSGNATSIVRVRANGDVEVSTGGTVRARVEAATGIVHLGASAAAEFVALAAKTDARIKAIADLLKGWVVVPNDGGAALQAAANLLWPADPVTVAATKAKAT